eukprot:scaffold32506_cov112-Isochrysis_galbana.AAC.1
MAVRASGRCAQPYERHAISNAPEANGSQLARRAAAAAAAAPACARCTRAFLLRRHSFRSASDNLRQQATA